MKQFFKNTTATVLALLVLFSTFSFTVEKHYCGDFLVSVSYLGNADNCGMEMSKTTKKKKNCCKDEVEEVRGQDTLKQHFVDKITFKKQVFLISYVVVYSNKFLRKEIVNVISRRDFPPPDFNQNLQTLYQVFLI